MPPPGMALPGQFSGQFSGQFRAAPQPQLSPKASAALPGLLSRPPAANPAGLHPGAGGMNMQGLRMDPWKALVIRWDPDTTPNWPQFVSPWEVR